MRQRVSLYAESMYIAKSNILILSCLDSTPKTSKCLKCSRLQDIFTRGNYAVRYPIVCLQGIKPHAMLRKQRCLAQIWNAHRERQRKKETGHNPDMNTGRSSQQHHSQGPTKEDLDDPELEHNRDTVGCYPGPTPQGQSAVVLAWPAPQIRPVQRNIAADYTASRLRNPSPLER